MKDILTLLLMLFASLVVFYIIQISDETQSTWVKKLINLSKPISKTNPVALFAGFFVYISLMLWLVLNLFQYNPNIVKAIYVFSMWNVSFTSLSLWLDKYWSGNKYSLALKVIASTVFSVSWVYYPAWFVYNTVGVLGAVAFVTVFPRLDYKRVYAVGLAIVIYDILGVYILGWIIELVRGFTFTPPAVLMIPTETGHSPHVMIIGLGDIIIGALFIKMAKQYKSLDIAVLGYLVSIILAYLLAISSNHPVPATIFISPIMLLVIWVNARKQGFKNLLVSTHT